jgi:unsaturated pyranuronate lyase
MGAILVDRGAAAIQCPRDGQTESYQPWRSVLGFVPEGLPISFVDVSSLRVIERLPGWHGRYFHSQSMTFAHYDFVRGSSIHKHFHPQEEVYEVIEGELELTIDGVAHIARPGLVAIVPAGVGHSVKALTDGRAIIVDYPLRPDLH